MLIPNTDIDTGELIKKKKKCLILHGVSNSGKTTIGEHTTAIFITHVKKQPKGNVFEEKITPKEANV